jgi:cell filamentation protein
MYDAASDSYCYPGTTVLKNRAGLRTQADLDFFEEETTAQRFDEPLPSGNLDLRHLRAIHRHLFQDVMGRGIANGADFEGRKLVLLP